MTREFGFWTIKKSICCVGVYIRAGIGMATNNVIFIDDDPATKSLASKTGVRLDCEFLFFERATDVFACIDWLDPKLVVLDLMMTNLSDDYDERAGIQISTAIREHFGDRFPILILTGTENPRIISECLRGGADDYYAKSHDFNRLIKRIAAWLVVDYAKTDAKQEREIAANALEKLVAQKGLLTVNEWRDVAMLEICRIENSDKPNPRNSTSDLIAWRKTTLPS